MTDFGLCVECDDSGTFTEVKKCALPIRWLDIESMTENRFSEKSDMYEIIIKY